MSTQTLSFLCPGCSTKLTAIVAAAGKRVPCPHCGGNVLVPEDLSVEKRKPESTTASAASSIRSSCPQCGHSSHVSREKIGDEIICGECLERYLVAEPEEAKQEAPPRPAGPTLPPGEEDDWISDLEVEDVDDPPIDTSRDEQPAPKASDQETVPAKCPVCGTRVVAPSRLIGRTTPCPDCFSEVPVKSPSENPAAAETAAAVPQILPLETHFSSSASSNTSANPTSDSMNVGQVASRNESQSEAVHQAATGVLAEAEREQQEKEDKERELIIAPEDQLGGAGHFFTFLRHPGALLWIFTLSIGMYVYAGLFKIAGGLTEGWAQIGGVVFQVAAMFFFSLWLIGACGIWLSVAQETAVGKRVVDEWNFSLIGETLGDMWIVLFASMIAFSPGLALVVLTWGDAMMWGLSIAIYGFLFPFILLSLLDNESLINVVSASVVTSIGRKIGTWLIFWGVSIGVLGLLGLCIRGLLFNGNPLYLLCVVSANLLVMLFFRLIGMLAWKIFQE